jgi:hypothetical protein
MYLGGHLCPV